jgi:hypothetical protein
MLGNWVGLGLAGDGWVITDNWIHTLSTTNGNHNDGIQVYDGDGSMIARNRIDVGLGNPGNEPNSAIFTQGPVGKITIDSNYLNGGAFTLYLQNGSAWVTNNVFGPANYYGSVSTQGATISSWSNNCKGDSSGKAYVPCQAVGH